MSRERRNMALRIGDVVLSTYAARWTGTVLGPDEHDLCCLRVLMMLDQGGRPVRKPTVHILDEAWLQWRGNVTDREYKTALRDVCDTILTVRDLYGPPDDLVYKRTHTAMSSSLKRAALAQVWLPEAAAALMRAIAETQGVEVLSHRAVPLFGRGAFGVELRYRNHDGETWGVGWAMKIVPLVILDMLAARDKAGMLAAMRRKW